MAEEVIIYTSRTCAFSLRVISVLEFLGISYTLHYVDLNNKAEWFLKLNPKGETPVVKIGETVLSSSDEIIELFEKKHPEPSLTPAGVPEEFFNEVLKSVKEEFTPSFGKAMMVSDPAMQQDVKVALEKNLEKLNSLIARYGAYGPYFFGHQVSKVDLYLAPFLDRLNLLQYYRGIKVNSNLRSLLKYITAVVNIPAYQKIRVDQPTLKRFLAQKIARPLPLINNQLQHYALRFHAADLIRRIDSLSPGDEEGANELAKIVRNYVNLILGHADMEETILFPEISNVKPGAPEEAHSEHVAETKALKKLKKNGTSLPKAKDSAKEIDSLRRLIHKVMKSNLAHLVTEEKGLQPLTKELKDVPGVFKKIAQHNIDYFKKKPKILPFLFAGLEPHQIQLYLQNIETVCGKDSKIFAEFLEILKASSEPNVWPTIVERLPHLESFGAAPPKGSVIFVTGATGQVGFETVKYLGKNFPSVKIRAAVRDAQKSKSKFEGLNLDVVEVDTSKPQELVKAIAGSSTILIIPPAEGRVEVSKAFIAAAAEAQVEHIAVISVGSIGVKDVLFARQFGEIENAVKETIIPWTFLRAEFFLENLLWDAGTVKSQATVYAPVDAYGRFTPVSYVDIGATAATVLANYRKHFGKIYRLTGAEAISLREIAGLYTQITERIVKFQRAPRDVAIQGMIGGGVPQWQAEGIAELWDMISDRMCEEISTDITKILGRDPLSAEEFVLKNAETFK